MVESSTLQTCARRWSRRTRVDLETISFGALGICTLHERISSTGSGDRPGGKSRKGSRGLQFEMSVLPRGLAPICRSALHYADHAVAPLCRSPHWLLYADHALAP